MIPFQPPIKRSKPSAFEGKQDAYRHQLTWIQLGFRMLRYLAHLVIDMAENAYDNIFCGHVSRSTTASTPIVSPCCMTISTYYPSTIGYMRRLLSFSLKTPLLMQERSTSD